MKIWRTSDSNSVYTDLDPSSCFMFFNCNSLLQATGESRTCSASLRQMLDELREEAHVVLHVNWSSNLSDGYER
jgi:hypothetical protein